MSSPAASSAPNDSNTSTSSRRAKNLFGDCALVEIIHLHECFRGALRALEVDVTELCREISKTSEDAAVKPTDRLIDLERRVAGRFTVIWSVFRAHSAAEDEFIWPALKAKQVSLPDGACSPCHSPSHNGSVDSVTIVQQQQQQVVGEVAAIANGVDAQEGERQQQQRERAHSVTVHQIEQEEYEEDHADEERMFNSINELLSKLREELLQGRINDDGSSLQEAAKMLLDGTGNLMHHLLTHLDKEETHCMPLVAQYLTKSEINDLVGKIMGKRSSELMSQILTMAVQNLNDSDRDDMVRYMKQAMVGTFFERWLKMGGWISSSSLASGSVDPGEIDDGGGKIPSNQQSTNEDARSASSDGLDSSNSQDERKPTSTPSTTVADATTSVQQRESNDHSSCCCNNTSSPSDHGPESYTSAAELEKLIRAIGTNPNLDTKQKNLTIQGLRDSVWKSNCRVSKRKREDGGDGTDVDQHLMQAGHVSSSMAVGTNAATSRSESVVQPTERGHPHQTHHLSFSISQGVGTRFKRETPPSSYFTKSKDGEVKLVWSSDPNSKTLFHPNDGTVPLFSTSELAPTYHDGGINRILGCPHYARSCECCGSNYRRNDLP
eukprot:CCRYP_012707-RB/>CCRYP_012707-RB protein AED:0.02 eAED:0.02 QI:221/1/1/1/1/1/4/1004/607